MRIERLKDNSNKLESEFVPLETVKQRAESVLQAGGTVTNIVRKSLGKLEKETQGGRLFEASEKRQVYEVVIEYPDGFNDLKLGWVKNAKITLAIDAENEQVLLRRVEGQWEKGVGHPPRFTDNK